MIQRRRTKNQSKNDKILFDGIRDKKLKANWDQTPQPIVTKLITSRCMRDKIPKGDYIIRATLMDRLVDNKLYYKFVEYGQRIKQQKLVDKERAYRRKAGMTIDNLDKRLDSLGEERDYNADNGENAEDEERHKEYINAPLFDSVADLEDRPLKQEK